MNIQSRIIAAVIALIVVLGLLVLVGSRWGIVKFAPGSIVPSISLAKLTNHVPSLDRPVNFPSNFPQDARPLWNDRVAKTKAALEKDPADVGAWFDLAIDYRMVGDYAGAVAIWKYISATYPQEPVSLHNLGEYNFHTAKDYPTAESYYRKSIAVAPQLSMNYSDLFDMYRYVYKQNTTAAADIVKEGIARVSARQAIDLIAALGAYYKDKGDSVNARIYFTQAREAAKAAGNAALVYQLDQQIAALKK